MKIYEIGTGYTPIPAQVAAATESVVEELTKAYLKMGIPVEIIDISAEKRAENDLPITQVNVPGIFTKSDVSLGLIHKLKRVVYSVFLSFKLKKILKKLNEKAVFHFHNQYNLFFFSKLVSKRLRSKAIIAYTNHNGLWALPWDDVKETLHKRYFQEIAAMKSADLVFALNSKTKENIISHIGVEPQRVFEICNGVNTEVYSPLSETEKDEIRAKYNLSGKKVILQVGSVYENKGQARCVEMLAPLLKKHDNLVYAFAGGIVSQEYFEQVNSVAQDLGVQDKVIYLGSFAPGEEMNRIYNLAESTVFASRYEGFPLVCIESLSAGVPVVICSETVRNFGNGCMICKKDGFEKSVSNVLLSESSQCSSLSGASRETAVQNFSWEKIARDYLDIFNLKQ